MDAPKTEPQVAPSVVSGAKIMASVLCVMIYPAVACFLYVLHLADFCTSLCLAFVPTLLGLVWNRDLQTYILKPSEQRSLSQERFRLFYWIVKAGALIFFILVEMYTRKEVSDSRGTLDMLLEGFSVFHNTYVLLPLAVHFLASLLTYAGAYTSLALREPLFGITLPSLISMVLTIMFCVIQAPGMFSLNETTYFGPFPSFLICASFLAWAWAWPYILNSSSLLTKPRHLLTPFNVLFVDYGWNPVFADQTLLVGFDCSKEFSAPGEGSKVKTRIYICTTMYREADYEMERLLVSLDQLTSDPLLQDVYFESNIFMDNGCRGDTLTEFALQFISLLDKKLAVSMDKCRCLSTPYGIQISSKVAGKLWLFLHLKDPQKVKAKKRWSQSMYINYVMKYRKTLWKKDSDNKNEDGELNIPSESSIKNHQPFHLMTTAETGEVISNDLNYTLRRITNVGCPAYGAFSTSEDKVVEQISSDDASSPNSERSSQILSSHSSNLNAEPCPQEEDDAKGHVNKGFLDDDLYFEQALRQNRFPVLSPEEENMSYQGLPPLAPSSPLYSKLDLSLMRHDVSRDVIKEDALAETVDSSIDVWATEEDDVPEGADFELVDDDHTFILATDADMEFHGKAVKELLELCGSDLRVGAACGRTHPIGKRRGPIVWHQVFEYAKDFWMIKNAQNIIGSVSCCPGCFSLYRASAIRDVMDKYSTPTRSPWTVYVKDTGEDRWMATLMMINGWRMRYSPFADNSTYCPDTFEEYYKQRRRWILSDMANAVLAVQNIIKLIRNNECFSLMYVVYLVNMFLNTVITPGTAVVMITAGLELVFDIPYVYTTLPLASVVYLFAILCTCTKQKTQVTLINVLTFFMGGLFSSVALYGCYKITSMMVEEAKAGAFHFQQHYMILLLALSLVYASLMHPMECYQIVYGFAYLFIFPAMHVLLPLYSIANIIDQSWGTRDGNQAKVPKLSCLPNLKSFVKRRRRTKMLVKNGADTEAELQSAVSARLSDMRDYGQRAVEEHKFWADLASSLIGVGVNTGLEKAALAQGLRTLRNRTLATFLGLNALWLAMLSYFYLGADSPLARLNIYGVMSGALYGFTLAIQLVGLTAGRLEQVLGKIARQVCRDGGDSRVPLWVHRRQTKE
ncbi:chitin synthase [Elysia marginata]|uniref:chitin synthase n=1 Tax=Elysia marginata TaxID=1093978 RepID=A0AAV4HQW7_9GAST|nr:chitin synthase [Elysia marginata]